MCQAWRLPQLSLRGGQKGRSWGRLRGSQTWCCAPPAGRADGGLSTGKDVVFAALMGAEEFDFGKLLLIAQGCVMARICEKNTCPTGIATHDPKFKAKYKGEAL